MAAITTAMIKELREKTGAGIMDAKKALQESDGNIEEAVDFLRKKGLATAEKKSSRTAAEGLVSFAIKGTKGALIELNAETDFVARNEKFQNFVEKVTNIALQENAKDVDAILNAEFEGGKSVGDSLTDLIATIGENMALRRADVLSVNDGVVVGYMHNSIAGDMGKIGVLVALESTGDKDKLQALGKQIAMHIAAAFPQFLDRSSVDPELIEREKTVLADQARASGKPEEIIEKMVEGRMRKYFEEICLLDQVFVIDGESRVSDVIAKAKDDAGAPVELKGYLRFQLGEGIEKEEQDFAAEVAAAVNG